MTSKPFLFVACQPGAEGALKRELLRTRPELKFAYSRPGLVTFKAPTAVEPDVAFEAIFARAFGASWGPVADEAELLATVKTWAEGRQRLRLHVWDREDEPAEPRAAALRARLLAAAPELFAEDARPEKGNLVVDVITSAEDPPWLGRHRHGPGHSPWPGGRVELALPAEAPSRAYLKLEEALAWSEAPVRAGDVALEIGSAPGGASWALLARGLKVFGVDPGEMAPQVLAHPGFTHLQVPVGGLRREVLPPRVDWLLLDVNLAPQVAIHSVKRLVPPLRAHLLGVIFTLKLNDWRMADELPGLLARFDEMGVAPVRATQLTSNRQEICVVGLTEKGRARRGGKKRP